MPIPEVTRALGISEATYSVWRKRHGQMVMTDIRQLRQLEENQKLKQLVTDLTLDKDDPSGGAGKKALKPARKWAFVREVLGQHPIGCYERVGGFD